MAVVINEFEVVAEPAEGPRLEAAARPEAEPQAAPPPHAVEAIVRHLAERQLRVWAD